MKDATLALGSITNTPAKLFRTGDRLTHAEPYSRPAGSSSGPDDHRLSIALKRAVERDFAPQTLIDAIKKRIRNTDESQ